MEDGNDILKSNCILGNFIGGNYPEFAFDSVFTPQCDWGDMMVVLEKIHEEHLKQDIGSRDIRYTIDYLLERSFNFSDENLNLQFSIENLYKRAVLFVKNLKK